MEKLYAIYGKLLIEAEIIQGKINECKRQIAEALNKPAPTEGTGSTAEAK